MAKVNVVEVTPPDSDTVQFVRTASSGTVGYIYLRNVSPHAKSVLVRVISSEDRSNSARAMHTE